MQAINTQGYKYDFICCFKVWYSDCCVKVKKDLHHDSWRVWRFVAFITRGKLRTKTHLSLWSHFRCGSGRLHLNSEQKYFVYIIEWCGIVLYLMSDFVKICHFLLTLTFCPVSSITNNRFILYSNHFCLFLDCKQNRLEKLKYCCEVIVEIAINAIIDQSSGYHTFIRGHYA